LFAYFFGEAKKFLNQKTKKLDSIMQTPKPPFLVILVNTLVALIILFSIFFALLNAPDWFWQLYSGTFRCLSRDYLNIAPCSLEIFVNELKTATGVFSRTYEALIWGILFLGVIVYHLLKYEIKQ